MAKAGLIGLGLVLALIGIVALVLLYQGKRRPDIDGQYVAMGSSFAAGLGLGQREAGSPFICMRSVGGYPHLLARISGLKLVSVACSGSTTQHMLQGGPAFLRPQLEAVGPEAKLVTVTSGGNDVGYVGDLTMASGAAGSVTKWLWKGAKPVEQRDFAKVTANLIELVTAIKARAPKAQVVLVSYPAILPLEGSCAGIGIDAELADLGRVIATRLSEATKLAAEQSGARFVDMGAASVGHDACAAEPWVNGAKPGKGTPFHPSAAGAKATAEAIWQALAQGAALARG